MWEDDDEMDAFETGIDRFFSQTFSTMANSLFDVQSKALKPLFRLEINDEWVTVVFDLPGARKEDIEVTCTENMVSVEAQMSKPVSMRVLGNRREATRFERYTKKIQLPVRVDPEKGTAKYRNGMIVVKLPITRVGKSVKILDR